MYAIEIRGDDWDEEWQCYDGTADELMKFIVTDDYDEARRLFDSITTDSVVKLEREYGYNAAYAVLWDRSDDKDTKLASRDWIGSKEIMQLASV